MRLDLRTTRIANFQMRGIELGRVFLERAQSVERGAIAVVVL